MSDRTSYCGTPTELSSLLSEISDDKFSNRVISKYMKKLSKELEKRLIMGDCRRSNGKRIVELVKISVDSDSKIGMSQYPSLSALS